MIPENTPTSASGEMNRAPIVVIVKRISIWYNVFMNINQSYKYRIYPTRAQTQSISMMFGCCRFVYNYFLNVRRDAWSSRKEPLSCSNTSNMLTVLKRDPAYLWLAAVDSMALQESLKDLDRAYQNFFSKRAGYPKFKSRHNHHQSYRTRCQNNNIRIEGNYIVLPKLGRVKIRLSRSFSGRILNATVSRTPTDKYYVSLCVEEELVPKPNGGGMVGIDVGVKEFYTDSNGNTVDNPKTLRKYERKLRHEQRRLSRKKKGSSNYDKQRKRVASVHEKIFNVRTDFLHKESTRLVSENQVIAIESLNVKGMVRNRRLAKAISDASWGRFFDMLEYKAFEHGCDIIKVPTFYPSSQTCSCCGYRNPLVKNLAVRSWECPECGSIHGRDYNAATNILAKALELRGSA